MKENIIFNPDTTNSIDKEVLSSDNWFENEWRKLEQKGYNPAYIEELHKLLTDFTENVNDMTLCERAKTALQNAKL